MACTEISGPTTIWKIRKIVPSKIWTDIPREPFIKDLEQYLQYLKEYGLKKEAQTRNIKAIQPTKTKSATTKPAEKSQPQESTKTSTSTATKTAPSKPKAPTETKGKPKAKGEEGVAKDKTWDEAHKGISQDEINARKTASPQACTLCGEPPAEGMRWPHSWKKCPGPKRTSGGPYKAAGISKKRKRETSPEPRSEPSDKKADKAAAFVANRLALFEEDSDDGVFNGKDFR